MEESAGVALSLDDFQRCGWEPVSEGVSKVGPCERMSERFQQLARAAEEAGDLGKAGALQVLADVTSMMLADPSSGLMPYRPLWQLPDGQRTALPEDIKPNHLAILREFFPGVADPVLRARIADLLWIAPPGDRNPEHARAAINAYIEIPIQVESWAGGGKEAWQRATTLSIMLGDGAETKRSEIKLRLLESFRATDQEQAVLAGSISEVLRDHILTADESLQVASRLEEFGLDESISLHIRRELLQLAVGWFGNCRQPERATDSKVAIAETWEAEANACLVPGSESHMQATACIGNAINAFREIPRVDREARDLEPRIVALQEQLAVSGELAREEMGVIDGPSIDLSEQVARAREAVSGKGAIEALYALAGLCPGPKFSADKTFATELLEQHPLQRIFSTTHFSEDGRVVARTDGHIGELDPNGLEAPVWSQMISHFVLSIDLTVRGALLPALRVIAFEHRFTQKDCLTLVLGSPIIPRDHAMLFAKGIFAGLDHDYSTAVHLLAPQIEHMVRFHLKASGEITTKLEEGIRTEKGLSALLKIPKTKELFGEDVWYEMSALFCEPRGPNLRNYVAHGLLGDRESNTPYTCYAWWFALRLVVKVFVHENRTAEPD